MNTIQKWKQPLWRKNGETNEPHKFRLRLADKVNLKDANKNMALANSSIYYTWKNIRSA